MQTLQISVTVIQLKEDISGRAGQYLAIYPGERLGILDRLPRTKEVKVNKPSKALDITKAELSVLDKMSKWTSPKKPGPLNTSGVASSLKAKGFVARMATTGNWSITDKGREILKNGKSGEISVGR